MQQSCGAAKWPLLSAGFMGGTPRQAVLEECPGRWGVCSFTDRDWFAKWARQAFKKCVSGLRKGPCK